jgi:hypothetical protein
VTRRTEIQTLLLQGKTNNDILKTLQNKGWTLSTRTVFRDINALKSTQAKDLAKNPSLQVLRTPTESIEEKTWLWGEAKKIYESPPLITHRKEVQMKGLKILKVTETDTEVDDRPIRLAALRLMTDISQSKDALFALTEVEFRARVETLVMEITNDRKIIEAAIRNGGTQSLPDFTSDAPR